MQPMYPGQPNSPQTELATAIDDTQDSFEVLNGAVLPDAPNLAVIGAGELAETIRYGQKEGNILSEVERGFQGEAQSWQEGTKIARNFTAYDYDALRRNVEELQDELDNLDLDAANVKLESPHFTATNVLGGLEELFQRGVDVKQGLVDRLNAMNVSASTSETIDELLLKILDISKDANAAVGDVLNTKTFYQGGLKRTGAMPLRSGHVNAQSISRSGTTLRLRPPQGYVPGDTGNSIQWSDPNWIANNIRQGVSIFGLAGNLIEGKRWANGVASFPSSTLEIRGLSFKPSCIIVNTNSNTQVGYAAYYVDPTIYPTGSTRTIPINVAIRASNYNEAPAIPGSCTIYDDGFSIGVQSFNNAIWFAFE